MQLKIYRMRYVLIWKLRNIEKKWRTEKKVTALFFTCIFVVTNKGFPYMTNLKIHAPCEEQKKVPGALASSQYELPFSRLIEIFFLIVKFDKNMLTICLSFYADEKKCMLNI